MIINIICLIVCLGIQTIDPAYGVEVCTEEIFEVVAETVRRSPKHQQNTPASSYEVIDLPEASWNDQSYSISNEIFPLLMHATKTGQESEAKSLLKKGANVNDHDKDGDTPLMWAAAMGHLPLVELFLQKKANVNDPNSHGDTPLMWASSGGHLPVVNRLLRVKVNVDATSKTGWTALMAAANRGSLDIAKELVNHGANVHAKLPDGRTSLEIAQNAGKMEVVEFLSSCLTPFSAQQPYDVLESVSPEATGYLVPVSAWSGRGSRMHKPMYLPSNNLAATEITCETKKTSIPNSIGTIPPASFEKYGIHERRETPAKKSLLGRIFPCFGNKNKVEDSSC